MNLQEQHWDKLFGYLTNEANPWGSPGRELISFTNKAVKIP